MEQILIKVLLKFGLPIGIPLAVVVYYTLFPEKALLLSSKIWAIISHFWRSGSKKVIANNIEGHVKQFSKIISQDVKGISVRGIKIEWVKEETKEAFISKGRLVIRMRHHDNQSKNMAAVAMLYIGKTVVPEAKKLLNKELTNSIDLYLAKSFLDREYPDALNEYFDEYYQPLTSSHPTIKKYFDDYQVIDKHGLFVRVLIQELVLMGKRFLFKADTGKIISETNQLINFLKKIVERERGEHVPLEFIGSYTKVCLILVAKPYKRERQGITPYVNRFYKEKALGLQEIYLLAMDKENCKFLKDILKTLSDESDFYLKKVVEYEITDTDCWFKKAKLAMFQRRDSNNKLQ